jgi:hypothetical protein
MKYTKVKSTDFFEDSNFEEIISRLEKISVTSTAKWGTMNVAQMLHHLNLAIGSGLDFYKLSDQSSFLSRGFTQFMILAIVQKFPVNTKTPATLKVVEQYDFEVEKIQLKEILLKAKSTKSNSEWSRHTYFGTMTRLQWGKLIMIHCNHHFQQFEV